jgi:hypothetical protein
VVLVEMDADIIGGKECDRCRERLDGIWPVMAMERGRRDRAYAGVNGN